MSQNNNYSIFFSPNGNMVNRTNYNLNNETRFKYTISNEYNPNLQQPLNQIQSLNNFQLKDSIYANNITIKNDIKNNYQKNEYIDLSNDNKSDINVNCSSKIFNKKKSGDTIDFKTKWKTEKCHNWEMDGQCKFGENCAFAHGEEELKQKTTNNNNYKTKLCRQFFEEGFCPYGCRCQFSHKNKSFDFKNNIYKFKNIVKEKDIKYSKIISHLLLYDQIKLKVIKRPRLKAFKKIVNCSQKEIEENRLKLYLDVIDIKNSINNQKFC